MCFLFGWHKNGQMTPPVKSAAKLLFFWEMCKFAKYILQFLHKKYQKMASLYTQYRRRATKKARKREPCFTIRLTGVRRRVTERVPVGIRT